VDQLRENLAATGNYPEDLLEQIMSYDSLMDFTSTQKLTLSKYHPTLFTVRLCDDFDKSIGAGELTGLLQNILENFRSKFSETYGACAKWQDDYSPLENYDYPQALEILQETIEQRARYASEMSEEAPSFRLDGKGFNDIYIAYNSLVDSDVMRINSMVSVYTPSKNPDRLLTQYNNAIDELKIKLNVKKEELANLNTLISSYEKNETIYLSGTDALSKIDGNSSATYDALVRKQKAIADEITDINTSISRYEIKIDNLTGGVGNDREDTGEDSSENSGKASSLKTRARLKNAVEVASVESEIANLETQVEDIWSQFAKMLEAYTDQELNEQTVRDSKLRYDTPGLLSGAFVKKAIKTAGPFVAIGFIICMLMLLRIVIREEKERNRLAEENM
jgi:hypothetical protein